MLPAPKTSPNVGWRKRSSETISIPVSERIVRLNESARRCLVLAEASNWEMVRHADLWSRQNRTPAKLARLQRRAYRARDREAQYTRQAEIYMQQIEQLKQGDE